jgi:hypothetical protein
MLYQWCRLAGKSFFLSMINDKIFQRIERAAPNHIVYLEGQTVVWKGNYFTSIMESSVILPMLQMRKPRLEGLQVPTQITWEWYGLSSGLESGCDLLWSVFHFGLTPKLMGCVFSIKRLHIIIMIWTVSKAFRVVRGKKGQKQWEIFHTHKYFLK